MVLFITGLVVGILLSSIFISIVTRARINDLEYDNEFLRQQLRKMEAKYNPLKE